MSKQVRRFNPDEQWRAMVERKSGSYVLHADLARVERERDELRVWQETAIKACGERRCSERDSRIRQQESEIEQAEQANAELRAEVEDMRALLLGAWAESMKLVADAAIVSAEVKRSPGQIAEWITSNVAQAQAQAARQTARVEALRKAVKAAYIEGFRDAAIEGANEVDEWKASQSAAALSQPEAGT